MEIYYGIKWSNLHEYVEPVKLGRIWCTARIRIRLLHWNIVTSNDPILYEVLDTTESITFTNGD